MRYQKWENGQSGEHVRLLHLASTTYMCSFNWLNNVRPFFYRPSSYRLRFRLRKHQLELRQYEESYEGGPGHSWSSIRITSCHRS
jgi:hypothetical protein